MSKPWEAGFEQLDDNHYLVKTKTVSRKKKDRESADDDNGASTCSCKKDSPCTGDTCVNYAMRVILEKTFPLLMHAPRRSAAFHHLPPHLQECPPTCPLGPACRNQRLQRRQYASVRVSDAGDKGWGVYATKRIPSGSLVLEYIGEVIATDRAHARIRGVYSKLPHTYMMNLTGGRMIDATRKGGIARFINHSCAPNARAETWEAGGEVRVGIFAVQDIGVGEEVTYNYSLEYRGGLGRRQPCKCGAPACEGFLGSAPVGEDIDGEGAEGAPMSEGDRIRAMLLWTVPLERVRVAVAPGGPVGAGAGAGEEGGPPQRKFKIARWDVAPLTGQYGPHPGHPGAV